MAEADQPFVIGGFGLQVVEAVEKFQPKGGVDAAVTGVKRLLSRTCVGRMAEIQSAILQL